MRSRSRTPSRSTEPETLPDDELRKEPPDDASASTASPEDENESSDLDDLEPNAVGTAIDDAQWDAFIPDDDELDPLPDLHDFMDEWVPDSW